MAIWVSRYSNKELRSGKYYPVGISVGRPRWPLGYELKDQLYMLAPRRDMLNMEKGAYRDAYMGKLEGAGREKVINAVRRLDGLASDEGKELVLLCYEDVRNPEDWCHRTMFSEWWADSAGELIAELPDPSVPKGRKGMAKEGKGESKEEGIGQLSLFDVFDMHHA